MPDPRPMTDTTPDTPPIWLSADEARGWEQGWAAAMREAASPATGEGLDVDMMARDLGRIWSLSAQDHGQHSQRIFDIATGLLHLLPYERRVPVPEDARYPAPPYVAGVYPQGRLAATTLDPGEGEGGGIDHPIHDGPCVLAEFCPWKPATTLDLHPEEPR